ncbi:hypothetical protein SMD11_0149 [Streptomyces albireticuli]|uniref:Uncharacterized protein n=2 Tax=Streptomyces TaxID=1883 RepID=A0A1Z2KUS8_9ACTN|nr:hypothetical protein SMD11_0149 [Streptomyces albireticuli]
MVLDLLDAHLVGEVRAQLAARLPEDFALTFLNSLRSAEPLPPERFVRATTAWIWIGRPRADRDGAIGAALPAVADTAGEAPLGPFLLRFPVGYDLLLGRSYPS